MPFCKFCRLCFDYVLLGGLQDPGCVASLEQTKEHAITGLHRTQVSCVPIVAVPILLPIRDHHHVEVVAQDLWILIMQVGWVQIVTSCVAFSWPTDLSALIHLWRRGSTRKSGHDPSLLSVALKGVVGCCSPTTRNSSSAGKSS